MFRVATCQPALFLFVLLALMSSSDAKAQVASELVQTVTFDADDVRVIRDMRYDRIHFRETDPDLRLEHEGFPQLPVKVVWFVLPRGTAVASVSHRIITTERLQGSFLPYPIAHDEDIPESPPWASGLVFPIEPVRSMGSGQYRDYQMAKIAVWPMTYEARTRRLTITTRMEIRVQLRPLEESEAEAMLSYYRPETIDGPFGSFRNWVASLRSIAGISLDSIRVTATSIHLCNHR